MLGRRYGSKLGNGHRLVQKQKVRVDSWMSFNQPVQLSDVRATLLALSAHARGAGLDFDGHIDVAGVNVGDHIGRAVKMTGQFHRAGDFEQQNVSLSMTVAQASTNLHFQLRSTRLERISMKEMLVRLVQFDNRANLKRSFRTPKPSFDQFDQPSLSARLPEVLKRRSYVLI